MQQKHWDLKPNAQDAVDTVQAPARLLVVKLVIGIARVLVGRNAQKIAVEIALVVPNNRLQFYFLKSIGHSHG